MLATLELGRRRSTSTSAASRTSTPPACASSDGPRAAREAGGTLRVSATSSIVARLIEITGCRRAARRLTTSTQRPTNLTKSTATSSSIAVRRADRRRRACRARSSSCVRRSDSVRQAGQPGIERFAAPLDEAVGVEHDVGPRRRRATRCSDAPHRGRARRCSRRPATSVAVAVAARAAADDLPRSRRSPRCYGRSSDTPSRSPRRTGGGGEVIEAVDELVRLVEAVGERACRAAHLPIATAASSPRPTMSPMVNRCGRRGRSRRTSRRRRDPSPPTSSAPTTASPGRRTAATPSSRAAA